MKRNLLLICALLSFVFAGARTLSPDEALSAALNTANGLKHAPAQTQYALARTVKDAGGAPAVYVFANTGSGFIITPADDCVEAAVLGYGAEMGETLPPNMQAWLDEYARQIEWLRNNPSAAQTSSPRRAPDSRIAIAPLCTSVWGQDKPFYNDCPTVEGKQCPTGCLATAAAQIMYYHKYPAQGTGTKSYEWTYNGNTYTDSFDFGNTTFDWDNMIDVYASGSYTDAQAQAVATLMHACGVAADMAYMPGGSSALVYKLAPNFINNLGYDKGMTVYVRDWMDNNAWETLIYNELAASRPVLYGGVTAKNEGHAFVCDGYSSDGFFHMNWGWKGMSDGYFILSMLNPNVQGTGGAESGMAFNFMQRAVTHIRPAASGSAIVPMIETNGILTDKTEYTTEEKVQFLNGFWNCAVLPLTYDIAIAFKQENGAMTYTTIKENKEIGVYFGYSSFTLPVSIFPTGEYDFYFVFRESGTGSWKRFYCNNSGANAAHAVKTATKLTLSEALYEEAPKASITASITKVTPKNTSDGTKYYPRHTYSLSTTITATADDDVYIAPIVGRIDGSENEILFTGTPEKCSLKANQGFETELPVTIPSTVSDTDAYMAIAVVDRNTSEILNMLTTQNIQVEEAIEATFTANITKVTPQTPGEEGFIAGHTYVVSADVTATEAGSVDCTAVFGETETMTVLAASASKTLTFSEGGTQTVELTITLNKYFAGEGMFALLDDTGETLATFDATVTANLSAAIVKIKPADRDDEGYYSGHTYTVCTDLYSVGANSLTCYTALVDLDSWEVIVRADAEELYFPGSGSKTLEQPLTIPEDYTGKAMFALVDDENIVVTYTYVDVTPEPADPELSAAIIEVIPDNPEDEGFYAGHTYTLVIEAASTGKRTYNAASALLYPETQYIITATDLVVLKFSEAGTQTVSQKLTLPKDYVGDALLSFCWVITTDEAKILVTQPITIEDPAGISTVSADTDAPAEYFTLQGVKVDSPAPGTLVIRRQGTKAAKVIIR